jgi:hypothetical protein
MKADFYTLVVGIAVMGVVAVIIFAGPQIRAAGLNPTATPLWTCGGTATITPDGDMKCTGGVPHGDPTGHP